jgi:hypothetical protein
MTQAFSDPDPQEDPPATPPVGPVQLMAMQIAWPSFLMAGVMEGMVFSVVDPSALHWFGQQVIDWPVQAVYTVSFFLFWLVIALACGISRALQTFTHDVRVGP